MSFINNLAKGFIRSAVNQVGRDGGKVISNKVYGNNHASPVNITNSSSQIETEGLIEEKEYIWIKVFWAVILAFFLPFLGAIIVLYRGFVNYNKKTMKLYKIESQAVYVSDKRYSTGQRYQGHQQVKIPVAVDINEPQLKKAKTKSYAYFIVGFSMILLYIIALQK